MQFEHERKMEKRKKKESDSTLFIFSSRKKIYLECIMCFSSYYSFEEKIIRVN